MFYIFQNGLADNFHLDFHTHTRSIFWQQFKGDRCVTILHYGASIHPSIFFEKCFDEKQQQQQQQQRGVIYIFLRSSLCLWNIQYDACYTQDNTQQQNINKM